MAGVARRRLDAELVRRKLARSREHAGQLIAAGRVSVGKTVATKSATQVETAAAIVVTDDAGAGFVHMAPSHGADDYELFVKNGLVDRMTHNVLEDSSFAAHVPYFAGLQIFDAKTGDNLLEGVTRAKTGSENAPT